MSITPARHGRPVELEEDEVEYQVPGYTWFKRIVTTVWVDVGEKDSLTGHRYVAWYRWSGLSWHGPLDAMDAPVLGPNGNPILNTIHQGEVVDPEPMQVEDSDGDAQMEFDGEDDVFGDTDEDPEEFPLTDEDNP